MLALAAWLFWRWLLNRVVRFLVRAGGAELRPLLLLRVFKRSGRSEEFMDRYFARWRFAAPVWMIAGPDLAGAFMEPDEFLAWLEGRLGDRFVADAAGVPERTAALDGAPDPDGRFRVTELFCANTTWQATVLALIERAGAVLLDLREYTEQRAGTRFELVTLLRLADLARVIVLTDEGEAAPRLRGALDAAWLEAGGRADGGAAPPLAVLQVLSGSDAEMRGLVHAVGRAAAR